MMAVRSLDRATGAAVTSDLCLRSGLRFVIILHRTRLSTCLSPTLYLMALPFSTNFSSCIFQSAVPLYTYKSAYKLT
jgi:hypothetical protein